MKKELEEYILDLTMKFSKIIPEKEQKKAEIVEAFKNYLYLVVKTIQESTSKFISTDDETIKSALNREAKDFYEKDLDSIKRELIVDESFEKIREESMKIFEKAMSLMDGKKIDEKFDIITEIEKMQKLLEGVKVYNEEEAKKLISEAILDLKYLAQPNEDSLSFRLYHFRESKSKEEER